MSLALIVAWVNKWHRFSLVWPPSETSAWHSNTLTGVHDRWHRHVNGITGANQSYWAPLTYFLALLLLYQGNTSNAKRAAYTVNHPKAVCRGFCYPLGIHGLLHKRITSSQFGFWRLTLCTLRIRLKTFLFNKKFLLKGSFSFLLSPRACLASSMIFAVSFNNYRVFTSKCVYICIHMC